MDLDKILEAFKDQPEAQAAIKSKFELADAAEKIKNSNLDLTRQREEWEKKEADYKKAKPSTGGSSADLNAALERIATIESELQKEKTEKVKAVTESRNKDLRSTVISKAGELRAKKSDQVFHLMQAEGLIGFKEDGSSFYHRKNDKGEPVAVDANESINWYLNQNPHLVDSSGNQGPGNTSRTSPGGDQWDPTQNLTFK